MLKAVLFDVDGTLVDSNDAHAAAWVKAFAEFNIAVDPNKVRRCIGMGGDKLMPAVSGIAEDSEQGSKIGERRGKIFKTEFLPTLKAFPGADGLVGAVKQRGLTAVAASVSMRNEPAYLPQATLRSRIARDRRYDRCRASRPNIAVASAQSCRACACGHSWSHGS